MVNPLDAALRGRRRTLMLGGLAAGGLATVRHAAHAADAGGKDAGLPVPEIEAAVGVSGSVSDGVLSLGLDRTDLSATLPGNIPVKPAFQLNGALYFQAIGDGRAIMNADYCLKPEETNPFMDALIAGGLTVMAFHQHLYDLSPLCWFAHFRGMGDPLQIAKAARKALDATAIPLPQKTGKNPTSPLDAQRIGKIIGAKAKVRGDGTVHVSVPRAEQIHLAGIAIKPGLNVSTPIAFQPLDPKGERAVAVPDFAMLAGEVDKVFAEMRKQGFTIGCLYNQETDEQPQLYFSHQWAAGDPYDLATRIRRGLDRTNSRFEA